ncbi:MAG TPA: RluA family pseudouridine synthase [Puia sp.]|nr:RluA family pseudouridine synthase [Puia sp.]
MQKPDIIFENEDFVAVNKPAGLLSIPDREGKEPSLKSWLKEKYGAIFTVHRLDRDTSGIIVFARHEASHKYLSMAFEERTMEKIYAGIVQGSLAQQQGSIDAPLMEHPAKKGVMYVNKKGKASLTDYEVQEDLGLYSLLQFRLHTGRTHQIRVHMQSLGHPIVCDELYGDARPILISSFKKKFKLSRSEEDERPILQRLALHSQLLHFKDGKGEYHTLEAPLPKDMRALLQQLRKWTHSS